MGNLSIKGTLPTTYSFPPELSQDPKLSQTVKSHSKFTRSHVCTNGGSYYVVKTYSKNSTDHLLHKTMQEAKRNNERLKSSPTTHLCPFGAVYEDDKVLQAVRAYHYTNLFSRINSEPLLTTLEKKWITYQLLVYLEQAAANRIYHGDIKCENILLNTWNWVFVTDHASYKPVHIISSTRDDFGYFFDSSGRRTCYLAPERFTRSSVVPEYTPETPPSAASQQSPMSNSKVSNTAASSDLSGSKAGADSGFPNSSESANSIQCSMFGQSYTLDDLIKMDVFSMGCVIAELWLGNAQRLFDNRSIWDYKDGLYDPGSMLKKHLPEAQEIRWLIRKMIDIDPSKRNLPSYYLPQLQAKHFFPSYFALYHSLSQSMVSIPAEARVERISSNLDSFHSLFIGRTFDSDDFNKLKFSELGTQSVVKPLIDIKELTGSLSNSSSSNGTTDLSRGSTPTLLSPPPSLPTLASDDLYHAPLPLIPTDALSPNNFADFDDQLWIQFITSPPPSSMSDIPATEDLQLWYNNLSQCANVILPQVATIQIGIQSDLQISFEKLSFSLIFIANRLLQAGQHMESVAFLKAYTSLAQFRSKPFEELKGWQLLVSLLLHCSSSPNIARFLGKCFHLANKLDLISAKRWAVQQFLDIAALNADVNSIALFQAEAGTQISDIRTLIHPQGTELSSATSRGPTPDFYFHTPLPSTDVPNSNGYSLLLDPLTAAFPYLGFTPTALLCIDVFHRMVPFIDDIDRLGKLIPCLIHLVDSFADIKQTPEIPEIQCLVLAQTIRLISRTFQLVSHYTQQEDFVFEDYILPVLESAILKFNNVVQEAYLESLSSLARCATKCLEQSKLAANVDYSQRSASSSLSIGGSTTSSFAMIDELRNLKVHFHRALLLLLHSPYEEIKAGVLQQLARMTEFFGPELSNDILRQVLSLKCDGEPFKLIVLKTLGSIVSDNPAISHFIGLCPWKYDISEQVVVEFLSCVSNLILKRNLDFHVLSNIVTSTAPLLIHPNSYVRFNFIHMIANAATSMNNVESVTSLMSMVQPFCQPLHTLTKDSLTCLAFSPVSRYAYDAAVSHTTLTSLDSETMESKWLWTKSEAFAPLDSDDVPGSSSHNIRNSATTKLSLSGVPAPNTALTGHLQKSPSTQFQKVEIDISFQLCICELNLDDVEDEKKLYLMKDYIKALQFRSSKHVLTTSHDTLNVTGVGNLKLPHQSSLVHDIGAYTNETA